MGSGQWHGGLCIHHDLSAGLLEFSDAGNHLFRQRHGLLDDKQYFDA